MKVGQSASSPRQGSFGIPPEMDPEVIKQKIEAAKKADARAQQMAQEAPAQKVVDDGFDVSDDSDDESEDAAEIKETPVQFALKMLKDLGVEMSPEDWSSLFFKGFVEKTITVAEIPDFEKKTSKPFTVTVRTMTAEENDVVDSLLAQDSKSNEMTVDGFNNRKQMWTFSCAIQKINGMAICKPKYREDLATKERVLDLAETVREKRRILGNMAPSILTLAIRKYWQFIINIENILANKDSYFLEKP